MHRFKYRQCFFVRLSLTAIIVFQVWLYCKSYILKKIGKILQKYELRTSNWQLRNGI